MQLHYSADHEAIATLSAEQQAQLETWFKELDEEHAKAGHPYGTETLSQATGVNCWLSFFVDGYKPKEALDEDLSHAYD